MTAQAKLLTPGGGGVILQPESSIAADVTVNLPVTAGTLATQAYANQTAQTNRIINGGMVIDQRNNGASVTPANGAYALDRWRTETSGGGVYTVQRSTAAPTGFTNSMLITVTTADSSIGATDYYDFQQFIEGFNVADLGWGTPNAQPVTISFQVRSSVTGTFAGSVMNAAGNRAYVFNYTINTANTWEEKSITIAGDTSGTWLTDNGRGIGLYFDLGNGSTYQATAGSWGSSYVVGSPSSVKLIATNGATFYLTGVQLEKGTQATPFQVRQYGDELALCQRYLPAFISTANLDYVPFWSAAANTTSGSGMYKFDVPTRVPPTGVTVSAASDFRITRPSTGNILCTGLSFAQASCYAGSLSWTVASGAVADQPYGMYATSASAKILWTGCEL